MNIIRDRQRTEQINHVCGGNSDEWCAQVVLLAALWSGDLGPHYCTVVHPHQFADKTLLQVIAAFSLGTLTMGVCDTETVERMVRCDPRFSEPRVNLAINIVRQVSGLVEAEDVDAAISLLKSTRRSTAA